MLLQVPLLQFIQNLKLLEKEIVKQIPFLSSFVHPLHVQFGLRLAQVFLRVLAVLTLTQIRTRHSRHVALAVFLRTVRLLAVAPSDVQFVVCAALFVLRGECVRVFFLGFLDYQVADVLVLFRVVAVRAPAAAAAEAAVGEAFAVQF